MRDLRTKDISLEDSARKMLEAGKELLADLERDPGFVPEPVKLNLRLAIIDLHDYPKRSSYSNTRDFVDASWDHFTRVGFLSSIYVDMPGVPNPEDESRKALSKRLNKSLWGYFNTIRNCSVEFDEKGEPTCR